MDAIVSFNKNILQIKTNISTIRAIDLLSNGYIEYSDFLRAQIVIVVSALDYYIHEKVRLGMLEVACERRPQPKKYMSFKLTMEDSINHLNSSKGDWLDLAIRRQHSWLAFQDPDKIKDVLAYIYDGHIWQEVGSLLSEDPKHLKDSLKIIVDRRNKIAHEADMNPSAVGERWIITYKDVEDAVERIESIVYAIDRILG